MFGALAICPRTFFLEYFVAPGLLQFVDLDVQVLVVGRYSGVAYIYNE